MAENCRKVGLYLRNINTYWQLSRTFALAGDDGRLGGYPLDITRRLTSGHYASFDTNGLPVVQSRYRPGFVHNYTTLCSFALGHWDLYLRTNQQSHLYRVAAVSDYILRTAEKAPNGAVLLRCEGKEGEHSGLLSAMNQGEAMSVLCRAWQATRDTRYIEAASGCLEPFDTPVEVGGVLGTMSRIKVPWYEEDTRVPLNHILNGMIYALWGLFDLMVATNNRRARELFEMGVESLVLALPYFDNGYWSLYCLAEEGDNYVSSIMYHNLHICQLTALHRQTQKAEFEKFARLLAEYARRPLCRLRAAASISRSKFFNVCRTSLLRHEAEVGG